MDVLTTFWRTTAMAALTKAEQELMDELLANVPTEKVAKAKTKETPLKMILRAFDDQLKMLEKGELIPSGKYRYEYFKLEDGKTIATDAKGKKLRQKFEKYKREWYDAATKQLNIFISVSCFYKIDLRKIEDDQEAKNKAIAYLKILRKQVADEQPIKKTIGYEDGISWVKLFEYNENQRKAAKAKAEEAKKLKAREEGLRRN